MNHSQSYTPRQQRDVVETDGDGEMILHRPGQYSFFVITTHRDDRSFEVFLSLCAVLTWDSAIVTATSHYALYSLSVLTCPLCKLAVWSPACDWCSQLPLSLLLHVHHSLKPVIKRQSGPGGHKTPAGSSAWQLTLLLNLPACLLFKHLFVVISRAFAVVVIAKC